MAEERRSRRLNHTVYVVSTAVGGMAAGAGLLALSLWDIWWAAAGAAVVAAVLVVVAMRVKARQRQDSFEDRSAKQVLLAYQEMAIMVRESLCQLPADLAPSVESLSLNPDDPPTAKSLADFSRQVGQTLGELMQNIGQGTCLLPNVCRFHLEHRSRTDSLQEFQLKQQTFFEVLHSFVDLISASTADVATPLSQEILVIKKAVASFVTDLMGWMETSQHRSTQEVNSIIQHFGTHTQKISTISDEIQHYNKTFRKELGMVVDQFHVIQERTGRISEISEQVKMLSLNAAIQAARAGTAGKSFQVISGEIQKLSVNVQEMAEIITTTISEATRSLREVLLAFDRDTAAIGKNLVQFNSELSQYDGNLEAYHKAFSEIIHTITTVSAELQDHIGNLMPLFQLQDMTLQQVGHLAALSDKIQEGAAADIGGLPESRKTDIRQQLFSHLEQLVTTDGELAVIDTLVRRHHLADTRAKPKTEAPVKIELF